MNSKLWPGLLIAFLAANAAIVAVTVSAARRDGPVAFDANVEDRSLRWDQWKRTQQESAALGWKALVEIVPASEGKVGQIKVTLADRAGVLANVPLRIELQHDAEPNGREVISSMSDVNGVAIGEHHIRRNGWYTVRVHSPATRTRVAFATEVNVMSMAATGAGEKTR